jgi:hypothetical protein
MADDGTRTTPRIKRTSGVSEPLTSWTEADLFPTEFFPFNTFLWFGLIGIRASVRIAARVVLIDRQRPEKDRGVACIRRTSVEQTRLTGEDCRRLLAAPFSCLCKGGRSCQQLKKKKVPTRKPGRRSGATRSAGRPDLRRAVGGRTRTAHMTIALRERQYSLIGQRSGLVGHPPESLE